MAAWMQQDNATFWKRIELFQKRINAHAVGFVVEPRIGVHDKTSAFKDGDVVFPRWVAYPYA
ncbi:hypothetical protein D3C80_1854220 [compost metagenome]